MKNLLKVSPPQDGLGPLAAAALNLPPRTLDRALRGHPFGPNSLAGRALPFVRAFLRGLSGDAHALRLGVEGLVGLGPGLTPSGDDWLGGFMTAAWAAAPSPLRGRLEEAADVIGQGARGRTPLISEGLLRLAVRGLSARSHYEFLFALSSEDRLSDLDRAFWAVVRMGHTSGWDALSGLLWGLRWAAEHAGEADRGETTRVGVMRTDPGTDFEERGVTWRRSKNS